ncbi:MAG: multifunctional CCA addition/repair protein [Candidatus Dasytiphilus stammeri]
MKIFLVGGAVRDRLLNLPIKDKDWVIVGSTPQELIRQGFKPVGKNFPVFLHPITGEEYALARTEKKSGRGYRGFTCYTSPDITLEQDLSRRDLTINAIACDAEGKYYDPFNGINDIFQRKLRHISNSFSEDPLRVLRVARFAACYNYLNFQIDPETIKIMSYMSKNGELNSLSAERIWKETEIALCSRNPILYFQILKQCHALSCLFPEIDNLYRIDINNPNKSNNMVLTNSYRPLFSLSIAVQISSQLEVRFACLCHDIEQFFCADTSVRNSSSLSYLKHISKNKLSEKFCNRLRVPKYLSNFFDLAQKWHYLVHKIEQVEPKRIITFFNKIDSWRKPDRITKISAVSQAVNYHQLIKDPSKLSYYPQEKYLQKIFSLAKNISVKKIIEDGYQGSNIHKELDSRRYEAIKFWKNK